MSKDLQNASLAKDLAELKRLFAAPLLSSECLQTYYTILTRFIESLETRDFVELMLVKELTDATWDIQRLSSNRRMVIEREHTRHHDEQTEHLRRQLGRLKQTLAGYLDKLAMEAEQAEEAAEASEAKLQAAADETDEADEVDQDDKPMPDCDYVVELKTRIDAKQSEINKMQLQLADEIDHAKALQSGIKYFEQLDRLLSVAIDRRNDVLVQLEFYRQSLGQRARRVSDDIIEGEFKETNHQAPTIVGPGDGAE